MSELIDLFLATMIEIIFISIVVILFVFCFTVVNPITIISRKLGFKNEN